MIKSILAKTDVVLVVALLLGLRALFDMTVAQSLLGIGFLALVAFNKYMASKQGPDINEELNKRLVEMESKVSGLHVKAAAKPAEPQFKRYF